MTLNTQPLIFKRPRSSGPSPSPQTPSVSLSWEDTTSAPLERACGCRNLHLSGPPINMDLPVVLPMILNSGKIIMKPGCHRNQSKHILILLSSKIYWSLNRIDSFVFLSLPHLQHTNTPLRGPGLRGPQTPPPLDSGILAPRPLLPETQVSWPPSTSSLRLKSRDLQTPSSPRDPSIRILKLLPDPPARLHFFFAKAKILPQTVTIGSPFPLSSAGARPPSGPSHFSQTKLPGNFLLRSAPPARGSPAPGREVGRRQQESGILLWGV